MIIYMDEIEIEPQRNLVPSRDLGLSQVPNRVSMEDPLPTAKPPTTLLDPLYLSLPSSSISNSVTRSSPDTPRLMPVPRVLVQALEPSKPPFVRLVFSRCQYMFDRLSAPRPPQYGCHDTIPQQYCR